VEQELFSVPNGMCLFPLFKGFCVDQSLLFCVYVMSTIAGQTTQWPKEKGQRDKQRYTKHT
jgi:hypothetical protein